MILACTVLTQNNIVSDIQTDGWTFAIARKKVRKTKVVMKVIRCMTA